MYCNAGLLQTHKIGTLSKESIIMIAIGNWVSKDYILYCLKEGIENNYL